MSRYVARGVHIFFILVDPFFLLFFSPLTPSNISCVPVFRISVRQLEELEAANPNMQWTPQSYGLSLWRAERDTWKLIQKLYA